jgi:membrane protease subunit HflC
MPKMPNVSKKLLATGALVLLLLIITVGAIVSGKGGFVEIDDTEVAVIVNYLTGNDEIVDRPGYKIFLPFVSQAFVFDKSPNSFVMEGDRDIDANHVRKLTVRAKDGSNFWFETLEIQYQIITSKANVVLHDSGPGDAFKRNWVKSYARSVLRDEFGRFSTEEIAAAQDFSTPKNEAKDRLNMMLEPHGINVILITTPKPKFDPQYEKAIEDRKTAEQQVEKLKGRVNQLDRERERRLAEISRDKETEYQLLLGNLERDRISEEKDAVRVTKTADAYRIRLVADGQAAERERLQIARGVESKARKEAEGLQARVEALAMRGEILVREELARKFAMIQFEIVPYRRDPAPTRIEHMGAVPGGTSQGGNQR